MNDILPEDPDKCLDVLLRDAMRAKVFQGQTVEFASLLHKKKRQQQQQSKRHERLMDQRIGKHDRQVEFSQIVYLFV